MDEDRFTPGSGIPIHLEFITKDGTGWKRRILLRQLAWRTLRSVTGGGTNGIKLCIEKRATFFLVVVIVGTGFRPILTFEWMIRTVHERSRSSGCSKDERYSRKFHGDKSNS